MSKIISVESYVDLNKVLVLYPFGKLLHFKTGKWLGRIVQSCTISLERQALMTIRDKQ